MTIFTIGESKVGEKTIYLYNTEFNLHDLLAGVYHLRFVVSNFEQAEKIIISK